MELLNIKSPEVKNKKPVSDNGFLIDWAISAFIFSSFSAIIFP